MRTNHGPPVAPKAGQKDPQQRSAEVHFGRFLADFCSTPIWWLRARFSSSRAARERKIEDRVASSAAREMIMGENYERNLTLIRSEISRFSRGTVQKTPEAARMAFAMGRENGNRLYAARPPAGSGGGLKWQTWQTFAISKSRLSSLKSGGREGIRTPGLLVANEALSQLSYSPDCAGW